MTTHTLNWSEYRRSGPGPFAQALDLIGFWYARARQRQQLAKLTDTQLRDIGVSRAQALREASKPFWK